MKSNLDKMSFAISIIEVNIFDMLKSINHEKNKMKICRRTYFQISYHKDCVLDITWFYLLHKD